MAHLNAGRGAVRVLVADSTLMGSQLILEALRQDNRFDAVGVFTCSDDLSRLPAELDPQVAVIAVTGQNGQRRGFNALQQALRRFSKLQVIALIDSSAHELVVEAFRTGARGVLCREEGLGDLRECIYAVHRGQIWATSAQLGFVLDVFSRRWVPQQIVDVQGRSLLSKRELDVVRCVSEGMTNREIANHLSLSEHTIKNYIFRTFDKLGVSNRAELILYAIRHGLTSDDRGASQLLDEPCPRCSSGQKIETPLPGELAREQRCEGPRGIVAGRTLRRGQLKSGRYAV